MSNIYAWSDFTEIYLKLPYITQNKSKSHYILAMIEGSEYIVHRSVKTNQRITNHGIEGSCVHTCAGSLYLRNHSIRRLAGGTSHIILYNVCVYRGIKMNKCGIYNTCTSVYHHQTN